MKTAQLANPFFTFSLLWKKYSDFWEKGCWGIWGLAPLLKYTVLLFILFFVPPITGWDDYTSAEPSILFLTFLLSFLILAFIWFLYFPVFFAILLKRLTQKTYRAVSPVNLEIHFGKVLDLTNIKDDIEESFYKFGTQYDPILRVLTEYFPFSLIYRDRIFHARNKAFWPLIKKIESISKKAKVPLYFFTFNTWGNRIEFFALFLKPIKRDSLRKLELVLQEKLQTIYIRKIERNIIRIIIPQSQEVKNRIQGM